AAASRQSFRPVHRPNLLVPILPKLHRERCPVQARRRVSVLAVVGGDVAVWLEGIAERQHDVTRFGGAAPVCVHLYRRIVYVRYGRQVVLRQAVHQLPHGVRRLCLSLISMRRAAERPEARRRRSKQRSNGSARGGLLEYIRDHFWPSLASSLSNCFGRSVATADSAAFAFSFIAGRINGRAGTWLVPNSTHLQWVVFPPGSPSSPSPLRCLAPPRMPTRIIGPPFRRSLRLPPPLTETFLNICSRVSGSSTARAFFRAASRITFAPLRSARLPALRPARTGISRMCWSRPSKSIALLIICRRPVLYDVPRAGPAVEAQNRCANRHRAISDGTLVQPLRDVDL